MDTEIAAHLTSATLPFADMLARLGLAVVLGGAIGLDREWREKPAGLRTHMLVSLAAATFAVITSELVHAFAESAADNVRSDPTRVIDAVVAGVAFLGAGSIIRSSGDIHGLTTGASIWVVGALGLACGLGLFGVALTAGFLGAVVLIILGAVERYLKR